MNWIEITFAALRNVPFFLILVVSAGLLLLFQVILAVRNLRRSSGGGATAWSLVLAVTTPLLVMFVMVMDVQHSHIHPLQVVATPPAPGTMWVFITARMGEIMILRSLYGLILLSAAIIGILGVASTRKISAHSGKIASLGVCIAFLVVGAGVMIHTIMMGYGLGELSYADHVEQAILYNRLVDETPAYNLPLILALVILFTSSCYGFMKSSRKGGTTPALVAGSLVFLIGGGAFLITRGHRQDTGRLPGLLKTYGDSNEILFTQSSVDLPRGLKNVSSLKQAPVIVIDDESVSIEGEVVLKIDEAGSIEGDTLPKLSAHLKNLEDNYKILHPGKEFEGSVILQSDREASTTVVRKVLRTCAEGKYINIQIPEIELEIFQTSVLGELRPVRNRSGIRFQLTTTDEPGSITLNDDENLEQLARRIDQAAANPPVKVRL